MVSAKKGYEEIARGLRTFGYPDVTAQMIEEIHAAWLDGKPIPHGVIGRIVTMNWGKAPTKPSPRE